MLAARRTTNPRLAQILRSLTAARLKGSNTMGLPQRALYPVHEAAMRWGCTVSDIAGWAAMGTLKIVTGIPPVQCGEERVAGLVNIDPTDILPMFRRCGTGPQEAHLQRIQPEGSESWLYITSP
jgi:hypothetical protein